MDPFGSSHKSREYRHLFFIRLGTQEVRHCSNMAAEHGNVGDSREAAGSQGIFTVGTPLVREATPPPFGEGVFNIP